MDQSVITEHDCNVLGGLFQIIVSDLKNGASTWDDFVLKASKFQSQIKATIAASTAFLDAFQKVADMATTTRGGTKEIGTALTRLCLRHRSVEAKLKSFSSAILDCLITPLQDRIEEWKKSTLQLDKEHSKELKRLRQEMKKRQICDSLLTSNSFRFKKHSSRLNKSKYDFIDSLGSKGIYGTIGPKSNVSNLSRSLDSEMECNERLLLFEELEKKAVRRALIEERSHFCLFVKFLRPVVDEEISMIQEISHIQEIMESLCKITADPFDLPSSSETVISNLKLNKRENSAWNFQTPPSSPSSLGSRKSSMCSISSYNSSSSGSTYGQTGQNKYLSLTNIPSYGTGTLSHCNQGENIYGKRREQSGNNANSNNNDKNAANINMTNKPFETNELQFQLESDSIESHLSKSNAIVISSTNPFLNSYNQATNDSIYQSTVDSSTNPYSLSVQDSNPYSEGSITPTNHEHHQILNANETDSRSNKSSKPPPAPPVRRTSSISNPNAITMGTLKSAAITGNYDELCKNISLYDEINVLTKSMNDINLSLKYADFTNTSSVTSQSGSRQTEDHSSSVFRAEPIQIDQSNGTRKLFACQHGNNSSSKSIEDDSAQLPLPAPPPEAFIDSNCAPVITSSMSTHHYNKITNVHREFLETLNSKLSQSPLAHQANPRTKRRSSSQSGSEGTHDTSSHVKQRASTRSSSTTRVTSSRKNSFESSNINNSFIDKLSQSLMRKQQNAELAKAVASTALQRKQSVPDLNELNPTLRNQNKVTFSSSLNLSTPGQSFQVVEIQTNPTQQPIYASRTQLRREIQELYGSIGSGIYGNTTDIASYQNGFFNKL